MSAPPDETATSRFLPLDVLLAMSLALWSVAEVLAGVAHGPVRVALPAALAMSVPFVWRRRHPLVVGLAVVAAFAAEARLGVDTRTQISTMVAMPAAAYAVASYARLRPAAAVLAVQVLLAAAASRTPSLPGALFALVVLAAGWGAGRAMRLHRRRSAALTTAVAREQQRADDAARDERARIARELHDIVAHAVSVMVIQSGAASEVMATDPEGARRALDSVRGTGQQALEELRRLLGVLRSGQEHGEFAPQPGLDQLPALVDQVSGSGLAVDLHVSGARPELPASLELAVFRIVQEALTNTVKHARATRARICLTYLPHRVEVEVVDDGRPGAGTAGGGHGLSGLRERAAMFGGTLDAGPLPEGAGFRVRARLPASTAPVPTP